MLDDDNAMNQRETSQDTSGASGEAAGGEDPERADGATGSTVATHRAAGRPAGPPAAVGTDLFSPPTGPPETKSTDNDGPSRPSARQASTSARPASSGPASSGPVSSAPVSSGTDSSGPASSASATPGTSVASSTAPAPSDSTDNAKDQQAQHPSPNDSASGTGAAGEGASNGGASTDDASGRRKAASRETAAPVAAGLTFQAPTTSLLPPRPDKTRDDSDADDGDTADDDAADDATADSGDSDDAAGGSPRRRRRSRGGRRRRRGDGSGDDGSSSSNAGKSGGDNTSSASTDNAKKGGGNGKNDAEDENKDDDSGDDGGNGTLRRRRRRRAGEEAGGGDDDPQNTVVKVREPRSDDDEISSVTGSTRLEAKKQRRREGREANRRRAPIVSEAEFLARRESVERVMAVRQKDDFAQIGVLEDGVLVEHYVARESQTSLIGNVYIGVVQNVLPSMEAAFIDIGKGRNAVIYAGEVDWSTLGSGQERKIEEALQPGQSVLVQVTKDPIGQKGARLTSQISLAGRYIVLVPNGKTHGISRKLPDTERSRLKELLKEILPDDTGVIVRTAAEGATEDQLTRDVTALTARWEDIEKKSQSAQNSKNPSPQALYTEPDVMIKVVRDLFNEDFSTLVVQGEDAWDNVSGYIQHVAPDLMERLERYEPGDDDPDDLFEARRVDEQIVKALDRKVFLPSGGSLVIDRTEAMTVVDVNTGKFTGSGGNLEETVTKNNLEAAEEIVRQLRLRDLGGIVVIDFIDMVLESNRELVLRRLVECLGRDRTRHQVAEVTSLGLVQMTRKRIDTGLLESFAESCEHCDGRGVVVHSEPIEPKNEQRRGRRGGRKRGNGHGKHNGGSSGGGQSNSPSGSSSDTQTDGDDSDTDQGK